jgi:squalene-hopene/tetraprenyl-beta-curcumene cyclase
MNSSVDGMGVANQLKVVWSINIFSMAAGEVDHASVGRGVTFLAQTQGADGVWKEERYTATGFPRVFYLRYHGYRRFFPLWAMARYRNLKSGNSSVVSFGM